MTTRVSAVLRGSRSWKQLYVGHPEWSLCSPVSSSGGWAHRFADGLCSAAGAFAGGGGSSPGCRGRRRAGRCAVSVAPCTSAMARTMARPSPCPPVWPTRSVPRRWNGWKRRSTSPGGITAPVLPIASVACPPVVAVEISTWPPSRLCRMALSTRFATRLSARLGSPVAGAAVKRGVDADAPAVGFLAAVHDRLPGDLGEIERLPLVDAALAAGQREQRVDEAFLLIAERQHLLAGRSQRLRGGVRDRRARPAAGSARR